MNYKILLIICNNANSNYTVFISKKEKSGSSLEQERRTFTDLLGECNLLMNKTCRVLQAARERVSDFHSDDTGGL